MSLKVPVEPTEALWYFCGRVAGGDVLCSQLAAGWLFAKVCFLLVRS